MNKKMIKYSELEYEKESQLKKLLEAWQHELAQIIAQEVARIAVQKLFVDEKFVVRKTL